MEPTIFGPYVWAAIHLICLGAPKSGDKKMYHTFFNQLPYILPCASCGKHLIENMSAIPIENADDLFKWSVDLHNRVNLQLSKPQITFEDAYAFWKLPPKFNQPNVSENKVLITKKVATNSKINIIIFFTVGLILGILITYLCKI
jgi:hypothetical protein